MAAKRFRSWDRERVQSTLDALEVQLASGATSIRMPDGSGVTLDLAAAERICDQLQDRLDDHDGTPGASRSRISVFFPRIATWR